MVLAPTFVNTPALLGLHLLGFSTGASLAAAYGALAPGDVATLGLQGPPLEFHAEGGMLDFRELVERVEVRRSPSTISTTRRPLSGPPGCSSGWQTVRTSRVRCSGSSSRNSSGRTL